MRPFERMMQQELRKQDDHFVVQGDKFLTDLRQCLKCFHTRSKHQILFHESFVQANLKNIYAGDFHQNEVRIKQDNLIDQIQEFALICCPRRFGKTTAVAMFIAAYLICCPNAGVVVFSPGKRQSGMLLKLIIEMAEELRDDYGWEYEEVERNAENFFIRRDGRVRTCKALPAKEEVSLLLYFGETEGLSPLTTPFLGFFFFK